MLILHRKISSLPVSSSAYQEPNPHLTVTLEETSSPANGESYAVGETVSWTITVLNDGNVDASGYGICELTGDEAPNFTNLAPGQTASAPIEYIVQETDLELEEIVCEASAYVEDNGDYPFEIETDESSFRIAPIEIDPEEALVISLQETSESVNGEGYRLGEKIHYRYTVTNATDVTLTNVVIKSLLFGREGTIAELPSGESVTFADEAVVTEANILSGEVVADVYASANTPDSNNPEVTTSAELSVNTEPSNPHLNLVIVETSDPINGEAYCYDEKVDLKLTLSNDGNLTISDFRFGCEMSGNEWSYSGLYPGESPEFTARYSIKEEDIIRGNALIYGYIDATTPDPEISVCPYEALENPLPVEDPNANWTIEVVETSSPSNGNAYDLGETVQYSIAINNTGNITASNIVLTAEISGYETEDISSSLNYQEVNPYPPEWGKRSVVRASYSHTITEQDILALAGTVDLTVTANADDPTEGEYPFEETSETISSTIEEPNGNVRILATETSSPANGTAYGVGEVINIEASGINEGNLSVYDGRIICELTGDDPTTSDLVPGQSSTPLEFTYTVTQSDIEVGMVVFNITGRWSMHSLTIPEAAVIPYTLQIPVA